MRKFNSLAISAAVLLASFTVAQATPFSGATTASSPLSIQLVAKKKAKKDAPGKCGTGKYFDKKKKKCVAPEGKK